MEDVTLVHKKDSKAQKIITDQLVYCQTSPYCMNGSCLNKRQNILKVYSLNIYQYGFRKDFSQHCLVSMIE